jgi:pimeloyl-ACP methyl ester carboxylesterase
LVVARAAFLPVASLASLHSHRFIRWRSRVCASIFTPDADCPFRVRGEFLDLSGARLYYYAAGTRGRGLPVVFIHGFPTSGHLWNEVIPLMPTGPRLVVLDLLGYGRSDRPLTRAVDANAHATRVLELFDQLRIERACVVAHGFGGGVAQALAIRFPSRVSHLCLVDSVGLDRWTSFTRPVTRPLLSLARVLPRELLIRTLRGDLSGGYSSPERAGRSIELYLRPFDCDEGRDTIAAHVAGMSASALADLATRLPGLSMATSIVWGQYDRAIPIAVGERLQRAIPASTLTVIPGARHFTPEDAPRPVADAVASLLRR